MKPARILPLAIALLALPGAAPPAGGKIDITVTGLRSDKGELLACMTADPETFPNCEKDPAALRARIPAAAMVELTFSDVPPGSYAIALLHDENANGKADRILGLMPKEGFGFSRDAKLRMGPPKFEDAAFAYNGTPARLTIKMRYLL